LVPFTAFTIPASVGCLDLRLQLFTET
jgi:hypothetical protein